MAKFTTAAGIDDLTGKLSKEDRIVMRQKKYRLPNGKIIKCGPKEGTFFVNGHQSCQEKTIFGSIFVYIGSIFRKANIFWQMELDFGS